MAILLSVRFQDLNDPHSKVTEEISVHEYWKSALLTADSLAQAGEVIEINMKGVELVTDLRLFEKENNV